jgi:phenylalanyl-tRNA synthetase alpha chain
MGRLTHATFIDIYDSALRDFAGATSDTEIKDLTAKYLGKNGEVNTAVKSLAREQLQSVGAQIKELKEQLQQLADTTASDLFSKTSIPDMTIPGQMPKTGSLHLVTQAIEEISDIFSRIGFVRRRYPEVDTDWYAAEGLNIPKDHPARDDQETFYVSPGVVLTAHTSNGQLREMERGSLPIKMINIGKTYRRQSDVSHTPMFHQFEGLVIDKDINITHLIGVCNFFAQNYFGQNRKIRLRPHHFQFTEPSFEVDISCGVCDGTGFYNNEKCRLCKSGWLELGGAGMVHPNVMNNGKITKSEYRGFAFGWGVERVLMMKEGLSINDLRDLYSTDYRYLSQF